MDAEEFKKRTKAFGIEVIRLTETLPRTRVADALARQLIRSATSVGANYRAACRARSNTEFISKLGIVEEEADESIFWLENLMDLRLATGDKIQPLMDEGEEILRLVVASIKTARRKGQN
jgi:four helix bundle protein